MWGLFCNLGKSKTKIMKLSIITVNYNQRKVTEELLDSLREQDYRDFEVIVVDNGSKDNLENGEFTKAYPEVTLIRSEQNLGFAGGNNLGIAKSKGEFIFFLNNDTEVPRGTLQQLINTLELNKEIGAVNPMLYYYDFPDTVQYAGYTPVNYFTGRNRALGYKEKLILSDKITFSPFAHGAALMIKRSVLNEIGPMPETYFLYYEELDWTSKIIRTGFKIAVDHRVRILHKESISTGKNSPLKTYFLTRNRILFMRRNSPNLMKFMAFMLFYIGFSLPKSIVTLTLKKDWVHVKCVLAGFFWNIFHGKNSNTLGYKL